MDNAANAALASSNLNAVNLFDNLQPRSAQQAEPAVAVPGEVENVARPPGETVDTAEFSAEALTLSQEESIRSMEDFRPVEQSRLEELDDLETTTDRFIEKGGWSLAEIDPETVEEEIVTDSLETENNATFLETTELESEEEAEIATATAQSETEAEETPAVEGTGATAAASTTTPDTGAATVTATNTSAEVTPAEPFPTLEETETIETNIAATAEQETVEATVTDFTTDVEEPEASLFETPEPVKTTEGVETTGGAVTTELENPTPSEVQENQAGLNAVIKNANGMTPEATAAGGAENVSESIRSEEQILMQNVGTQLAQIVPPPNIVSVLV